MRGCPMWKVQALGAFDSENPTHVQAPDGLGGTFDAIVDSYVNAISTNNASAFDTSRPCAVCDKPGHTFDDCPVLQNVDFLRKHYIQFKLFLKRQSNTTATTVNSIELDTDALLNTDPSFEVVPMEEDFHQGQE